MPLYYYFYDQIACRKNHEADLRRLEMRVIDLGINGQCEYWSPLINLKRSLEEASKHDGHTAVAVGDDQTFLNLAPLAAQYNLTVAFIPIAPGCELARIFGLPDLITACDAIAKRLIKRMDLGKANQTYFFANVEVPQTRGIKVECEDQYTVSTTSETTKLGLYNLANIFVDNYELYDPADGYLNLIIKPGIKRSWQKIFLRQSEKTSNFPIKKVKITSGTSLPVVLDNHITLKTPMQIEVKPKKIKVIVGRQRLI